MKKYLFNYHLCIREVLRPIDVKPIAKGVIHFHRESIPNTIEIDGEIFRRRFPLVKKEEYLLYIIRRNS